MRARLARIAGETVLTVLAIGGAICMVLVALAFMFNMTLVMFKTGSMSPTIPAGSVALVREIPASEIRIGDVVTVDRAGALPVTHRVTSVTAGTRPGERTITMRGDANQADDPAPYQVSSARIVMGSVPGLANVIVWFAHPLVLGGITLGASALVTWAFWPREPRAARAPQRRGRHALGAAAVLLVAPIGAAVLAPATPAWAADHVVQGTYLTLTSITGQGMQSMQPGTTVTWQVGVTAVPPEPGEVTVSLSGTGAAALELTADITACSVRWDAGTCSGQMWPLVVGDALPLDGIERELLTMPADEQRWLLFTVAMPATATPAIGDTVTQLVHAVGFGDTVVIDPGTIARTGTDVQWPLYLALLAISGGLSIALLASRLRRREES